MNEPQRDAISIRSIFTTFLIAGAISFGGGVVAYLRQYLVEGHRWVDDDEFLDALELSETLPGLNSINLGVIIGDRLRGVQGAAAAVMGLTLPGAVIVMALGALWEEHRHNPAVNWFLVGVAAAAVGLMFTVTLQLGHKQLAHAADVTFIVATFVAVSILKIPLLVVLILIGGAAIFYYRPRHAFAASPEHARHLRERLRSHRSLWRH
jgi:chromate transporter